MICILYIYSYQNIKIDINEIKLEWAAILRLIKLFRNYIVYNRSITSLVVENDYTKTDKTSFGLKEKINFWAVFLDDNPSGRSFDKLPVRIVYTLQWLWFLPVSVFVLKRLHLRYSEVNIACVTLSVYLYYYSAPYTDYDSACHSAWSSFNTWVINNCALSSY